MASFFGNKCTNLKFWGENSYPILSYPLTPLDCLQGASTKCSTECSAVPVTVFLQQALVCVVCISASAPGFSLVCGFFPASLISVFSVFTFVFLSFCVPLCLFLFYFGKRFFLCLQLFSPPVPTSLIIFGIYGLPLLTCPTKLQWLHSIKAVSQLTPVCVCSQYEGK